MCESAKRIKILISLELIQTSSPIYPFSGAIPLKDIVMRIEEEMYKERKANLHRP